MKDQIVGQFQIIHNQTDCVYEVDGDFMDKAFSFDIDEFDADFYFDKLIDDDGLETYLIENNNFMQKIKNSV